MSAMSTPYPTDLSAPVTPSLSFSNFRLNSMDSFHSVSSSSYCDSSPILRDFQEMTLSLTDEDMLNDTDSLFVFTENNSLTPKDSHLNVSDNESPISDDDSDMDDDESNPFLMGLAIKIPCTPMHNEEIESCTDEDEYSNNYFDGADFDDSSDFDTEDERQEEERDEDIDRKFMMKKYKYVKNIGIGSSGIVDKVVDVQNHKFVAIKQSRSIGDEVLSQFKNETVILRAFASCPYIINLVDFGRNMDANQMCIGLEYMDIGSLCNVETYTLPQIAYIAKCVLIALRELHQQRYVHNDIKPENILISSDGNVKLIDFGCTMQMNANGDKLTKSIGSIRYLSFEKRFKSPIEYDTKSDIYSFGVTICELFNAEHIRKKSSYDAYFCNASKAICNPQNADADFSDFISHCIEQDPIKRFSASELLRHPFLDCVPESVQFDAKI